MKEEPRLNKSAFYSGVLENRWEWKINGNVWKQTFIIIIIIAIITLLLHVCCLCDRNEPKKQSLGTMHQMLLNATTKGTVLLCVVFLYCSSFLCPTLCLYLPLISIFLCHLFVLSVTHSCVLSLSSPFCDWEWDLPKSLLQLESRWATVTDIISPKQITTLRIHSRPPLAPAKLKLCSPCQIESRKINK